MLQSKRVSHQSGRRTAVSTRRYFFSNQTANKKSFKMYKMILLALVISLLLPTSVFAAAPVFTEDGPFSITENSSTGTFVGQVVATGATSFAITAGNGTGAFSIDNSGVIRVLDGTQLDYETTQQFSLTVAATNIDGTTTATVIINIINVNDPPQMDAPSYDFTVNENESNGTLVGQVLATDPDPADTVFYEIYLGDPTNRFSVDSDDGEVRIADTNQIDFESGTTEYTIFVRASDGGLADVAPVTITINDANDPPVAEDDGPYSAVEDTQLDVDAINGVLANDTDEDQNPVDTLSAVLETQPANGTVLNFNPDGSFSYMPDPQFDGTDSFTYHVDDGEDVSNIATVTINVVGTNDAPTANDDTYATDEDTVLDVPADGVLGNDTDPENDSLAVTPFNGTSVMGADVTVNEDGSFSYDPTGSATIQALDAGDTDTDSFTYTISDGDTGTDTATVFIDLDGLNDAPAAVDDGPYNVTEDMNLVVNAANGVLANDTDADADDFFGNFTAVLDTTTSNGVLTFDPVNGSFSYIPNPNYNGPDSFTYFANDGTVNSNLATVTINVTSDNDDPIITEGASINVTMSEDGSPTAFALTLNATDADGDTLTWNISSPATNGTASASGTGTSKVIGYIPDPNYSGSDSFVVQVSDGNGGTDSITVNVTINPVNDSPVANDDSGLWATNEDTTRNVADPGVLANDTDQENDTLFVSTADTTSAMGAAVTVNANGSFSYDPTLANAIQALDAGDSDTDTFSYTAADGNGGTDTATVTIALTGVNDAPVAATDSYNASEDTILNISIAAGVLANDMDVDADDANTLTAVLDTTTSNGTLSFSTDGSFSYTPNAEFSGTDSFTYHANDGDVNSNTVTVTINVAAVNDPPVANDDSDINWATDEDNPLNIADPGVLANDTDPENDTLFVSTADATSAMGAAVTVNANGSFSYDPTLANAIQALDAGDSAADTFSYTTSDGNGGTDTATVTIALTGVNDVPVAAADSYNATEDTTLMINPAAGVLANDTDVDEDDATTLTAVLEATTSNGTLSFSTDGSFSYTPNAGFNGSDSFTYHANDGDIDSNTVTVTINVAAVNDPPTITEGASVNVTMSEDGSPTAFSLTLNGTDPEGNTLTWNIQSQASNGTATATGTGASKAIGYTPAADYNGSDSFVVQVSDGFGGSDTITVNVTITPVNDAPVAVDDSASTQPDTAVVINVLNNDTDVDNDSLSVTAVTQGSQGSVTHNGTTVTYTPNAAAAGSDTFTYTISDGNGGSDTATVTVQLGDYEIFLPMIVNNFVSAPDLVVSNVNASSDLIEVTIENQGTQATSTGFWVDFYIDPDPVPTHENQLWPHVSDEGIVWGVNVSIPAGGSLTLSYSTAPGATNLYYSAENSDYSGSLPVGTPVYAQVDSAHLNTTYGGVLETHEILGQAYNNVSSEYTAVASATSVVSVESAASYISAQPLALPLR